MVQSFDFTLFRWFNSWAGISPFFDWAIRFRAEYLIYVVAGAVLLFYIATFFPKFREYRAQNGHLVLFAFASALIARFGVVELIRLFYNRPRPFEALEGVTKLIPHSVGFAFPSGHATFAFALAAAVAYYYPKTSILFFLAALAISVSRVAAGLHWPSDIMGGVIVGIGTAIILKYIIFLKNK